jgi:hypothetical protein
MDERRTIERRSGVDRRTVERRGAADRTAAVAPAVIGGPRDRRDLLRRFMYRRSLINRRGEGLSKKGSA